MTKNFRGSYKWEDQVYQDMIEKDETERSTFGVACETMMETLFNLPNVPQSGKLLEVGCGDGYNTLNLAQRGYEIIAIDVAKTGVKLAQELVKRKNVKNVQVLHMDASAMTFEDNYFDVVVDATCLHCILNLEDRKEVLAEIHRVIKPTGAFLGTTLSQPYVGTMPSGLFIEHDEIMYSEFTPYEDGNPRPVRIVRTLEDLKAEFAENKFNLVWYKHGIARPEPITNHFVYHYRKLV